MGLEGGQFGKFVPEPLMMAAERSGGGSERKRGKKKGGRGSNRQERRQLGQQPRSIESAFDSYAGQMRNALSSTLSRNEGVLQVEYRVQKTMPAASSEGTLLFDISKVVSKAGTDVSALLKKFESRLGSDIKKRPEERIRLFVETGRVKVEQVKAGAEKEFENLPHLVYQTAERPAETNKEQTPEGTLARLRARFWPKPKQASERKSMQPAALDIVQKSISADVARDLQEFRELKGRHQVAREELDKIRSEKSALEIQLKSAQRTHARTEGALQQQVTTLQERLKSKEADISKLEQDIDVLSKKQEAQIRESRAETDRLSAALREAERAGKVSGTDLEQARARIKTLDDQVARLAIIVESTSILKSAEDDKLAEQGAALERLRLENEVLRTQLTSRTDNDGELVELNREIGRLTADLETANELVKELQAKLAKEGSESVRAREALKAAAASGESGPAPETVRTFAAMKEILASLSSVERDTEFEKITGAMRLALEDPATSAQRMERILSLLHEAIAAERQKGADKTSEAHTPQPPSSDDSASEKTKKK